MKKHINKIANFIVRLGGVWTLIASILYLLDYFQPSKFLVATYMLLTGFLFLVIDVSFTFKD